MPLLLVADVVEDVRHDRACHVEEDRRIGPQRQFVDRPRQHRGRGYTVKPLVQPDPEPLALPPRVQGLLERLGNGHHVRVGVERRWAPVGLGERLRDRPLGQLRGFRQHLAHRLAVEVAELAGRQRLLERKHLEKVELEIAHIALVMAHG